MTTILDRNIRNEIMNKSNNEIEQVLLDLVGPIDEGKQLLTFYYPKYVSLRRFF